MISSVFSRNRGFTLAEILIVMLIMSLVVTSIFSLYLTHLRNAYRHDDIIEVEQNLRIALDTITNDIKMSGMLIPLGTSRFVPGPLGSYSSCLTINSTSPDARFARITESRTTAAFTNFSTGIDKSTGFYANDRVRVFGTFRNSPVFLNNSTLVVATTPTSLKITLKRSNNASFTSGINVKSGSMIARGVSTSTGLFDTIAYSIVNNSTNSSCPANQKCLARSINGAVPEIVAANMTSMRFNYIADDDTESRNPSDLTLIKAIRVSLIGESSTSISSGGPTTKEKSSTISLRNKR
jgi:prepilin-type N-terminal cleavage/methylation domain-containing protein